MLFTEPSFLFYFLPALLLLHSLAPRSVRNPLLLVASLLFYAWGEPVHVALLVVSILVNYGAGRVIGGGRARGAGLLVGVSANLLLLAHFKYAGFVASLIGLDYAGARLPIGISFFTFQALSYLVDVWRRQVPVQRNPFQLALYISMFPQLIAGPIVRYHDVARQLTERVVTVPLFASGVRRFAVGLGKKMLIANSVALTADRVFGLGAEDLTFGFAWLGVACYTLQIYFDFSGYSDMAIGLGRMFGFRFMENFDHPYQSASIREFWRRWHISLSTWFRDYLYIPLGGGRGSGARTALNLWLVFLLCGLWHGASWNFVLWGAFHGLFLSVERRLRIPGGAAGGRAYTLGVVMVGWVFFRAETLPAALNLLSAMFGLGVEEPRAANLAVLADLRVWLALGAGALGATSLPRDLARRLFAALGGSGRLVDAGLRGAQLAAVAVLLAACFASVAADTYNPFLYFRF